MRRLLLCGVVAVGALVTLATGTACAGEQSVQERDDASRLLAVLSEPERCAASTTRVARDSAAISRFLVRNLARLGWAPGGSSLTRTPSVAMRSNRAA